MRTIKYFVFTCLLLFITSGVVRAESCDSDDIKRLKEIAKNVTVSYEYDEEREKNASYGYYFVTVSGLTEEIYAYSKNDGESFVFSYTSDNGGVDSYDLYFDVRKLDIYSYNCEDEKLRTIELNYPYYNFYYNYDECNGISGDDLYVCSKFTDKKISYSTFMSEIKKYNVNKNNLKVDENDNNDFIDFFKKNYYFVIIGILIFIVIYLLIKRWKNKNILD